mmetsp:Transcript_25107/g.63885  ORF Transcript_25107/g.63885 Transcript_25107/m.63885 type:complete len:212 (-) Transcript_25107:636-1271(-)
MGSCGHRGADGLGHTARRRDGPARVPLIVRDPQPATLLNCDPLGMPGFRTCPAQHQHLCHASPATATATASAAAAVVAPACWATLLGVLLALLDEGSDWPGVVGVLHVPRGEVLHDILDDRRCAVGQELEGSVVHWESPPKGLHLRAARPAAGAGARTAAAFATAATAASSKCRLAAQGLYKGGHGSGVVGVILASRLELPNHSGLCRARG